MNYTEEEHERLKARAKDAEAERDAARDAHHEAHEKWLETMRDLRDYEAEAEEAGRP